MSEEDKPKSEAQKEEDQKIADDAAEYIYNEVLGSGKKEDHSEDKKTAEDHSIASTVKDFVVETGSSVATSVSEAVTAGQDYISGVNEGVSKEAGKP